MYSSSIFVLVFVSLIAVVAYKVIIKKESPSNYYTPFDNITGQSISEFQEENEEDEMEEESDEGDDKNK